MSTFVDSSIWFAEAAPRDHDNLRAKLILSERDDHVTTEHVVVETWLLLNSRRDRRVADRFWDSVRHGGVRVETPSGSDWDKAWAIGEAFPDQEFSLVDRTSFAVMERLGIVRAASFDAHFAIYRYGRERNKAFDIVR